MLVRAGCPEGALCVPGPAALWTHCGLRTEATGRAQGDSAVLGGHPHWSSTTFTCVTSRLLKRWHALMGAKSLIRKMDESFLRM